VSLLTASFSSLRSEKSDTAKFIGIVCFAFFAIFHGYLIQIYFGSKDSKKLWFLDSNTEGFDIPLYASLITSKEVKIRSPSLFRRLKCKFRIVDPLLCLEGPQRYNRIRARYRWKLGQRRLDQSRRNRSRHSGRQRRRLLAPAGAWKIPGVSFVGVSCLHHSKHENKGEYTNGSRLFPLEQRLYIVEYTRAAINTAALSCE